MSTSVVKWSECLSNRVSIIIRRYTDHMEFAASFIFFWLYFVSLYIWLYVLYASYDKTNVFTAAVKKVQWDSRHQSQKFYFTIVLSQYCFNNTADLI